jgi:hypothetical protein
MEGRFFFARLDGEHFIKLQAMDGRSCFAHLDGGHKKRRQAPFLRNKGVAKSALGGGSCHVTRSTGAFARATLSQ